MLVRDQFLGKKRYRLLAAMAIGSMMFLASCREQLQAEVTPSTAHPIIAASAPEPSELSESFDLTTMEEHAPEVSSPPLMEWERISRPQRVRGTLTAVEIKDGYIQSIDIDVESNVYFVNSPVVYDYVGETLHLVVKEPLSAAGKLQDKLTAGSVFLVSFAQFAVPPDLEIELAARFSFNHFFFQQGDGFIDTEGHPFDLKAEAKAAKTPDEP